MEDEKVITVHIGDTDIHEWTMNEGKSVLMPILYDSLKKMFEDDLDEIHAVRVEAIIRKQSKAFDFIISKNECSDTLQKIFEWALDEEFYEICQDIKNFRTKHKL